MKKASKQFIFLLLCLGFVLTADAQVHADTIGTDFENFTLGSVNSQDGWTSGQGDSSCPPFDVAVVSNTYGYASFGTQSLRISNGITCGSSFTGQLRSPLLMNEAGETLAASSTSPDGTRQPYFEAQWDFASVLPGSEQPGLSVVASPDNGTGSRESWIEMQDTPSGLELDFTDYESSISNFVTTPIATSIDRTIPHTVKITINFIDSPLNDIVNVYLDGVLIHTGASWEGYDIDWGSGVPAAVNSVMFRVIDPPASATLEKGFLIDNFSEFSGPVPVTSLATATLNVIDNDEGSTTTEIFNVHVEQNGNDVIGSPAAGTTTPGTLYSLSPGTYVVSGDANASSTQSFSGDCDSDGNVTLAAGDNKTCTITNTDVLTTTVPVTPQTPPISVAHNIESGDSHSSGGSSPIPTIISDNQSPIIDDNNIITTVTTITVVSTPSFSNTGSMVMPITMGNLSEGDIFNVPAAVSQLQTSLASDGSIYPQGLVTGYFGPLTLNAVENFQIQNNVVSEGDPGFGNVGPLTQAALQKMFGQLMF